MNLMQVAGSLASIKCTINMYKSDCSWTPHPRLVGVDNEAKTKFDKCIWVSSCVSDMATNGLCVPYILVLTSPLFSALLCSLSGDSLTHC